MARARAHLPHRVRDRLASCPSSGEYLLSSRGLTLAEQGFIHAGDAHQVGPVANRIYRSDSADDLVVLIIDPGRLRPELRYEEAPGLGESFPHIYGPLNTDAVVGTAALERDPDGTFTFRPDGLDE